MQEATENRYVSFLRHSGWIGPEELDRALNIVGCGAVGSHIALLAAKMGFHRFRLWDGDSVEPHNLANQVYDVEHIGMYKTDALQHVLKRFNPAVQIEKFSTFFESKEDSKLVQGPLVIATDSMKSRKDILQTFRLNIDVYGVFEARLGFDYGEVHIIDNMNSQSCREWKETLLNDSEVEEGPCNLRMCTTLVQLVSSYLVHQICNKFVQRDRTKWKYKPKTCFSLSDELKIVSL